MSARRLHFDDWKEEVLQNPEVSRAYDDLAAAYQLARLRIQCGLSQQHLADEVGTTQSRISQLGSGGTQSIPSLTDSSE